MALIVVLVPSHGKPTRGSVTAPVFTNAATVPLYRRPSPQVVRVQNRSIRATRPLAERYLAPLNRGRTLSGLSVAFADAKVVGFVFAYTPPGGGVSDATLFAIRYRKTPTGWVRDYVHRGHGSAYVDEDNFAPSGFLPGSYGRDWNAYVPVLLVLLGVIVLVVLLERRLARRKAKLR